MFSRSLLGVCLVAVAGFVPAALTAQQGSVAPPFRARAVLQRGVPHPVFGTAAPGAEVVVSFAGQTKECSVGADGRWVITLDPLEASYEKRVLKFSFYLNGASQRIESDDVLVGETWLCGGQSNMQFGSKTDADWDLEALSLDQPSVRVLHLRRPRGLETELRGRWRLASLGDEDYQFDPSDSAIGYHFAARMQRVLKVPVGVICNAIGGTIVEAWIDRDRLAEMPECEALLEHWDQRATKFEADNPKAGPRKGPRFDRNFPGGLFDELVEPLSGFPFRGALFYQGESNAGQGWHRFEATFPEFVRHWRERLGLPGLPLGVISLAGFKEPQRITTPALEMIPTNFYFPAIRDVHLRAARTMPGVGLITNFDLGDAIDIHPSRKRPVADRAARWALATVYEIPGIVHRAPRVVGTRVVEGRMRLKFDSDPAVNPEGRNDRVPITRDGPYEGFVIAGEDRKFVRALVRAVPDERELEVWSPSVTEPVAVRYAWSNNPNGNALGARRLPVAPFRTDDWPLYEEKPIAGEARKAWDEKRKAARQAAIGG